MSIFLRLPCPNFLSCIVFLVQFSSWHNTVSNLLAVLSWLYLISPSSESGCNTLQYQHGSGQPDQWLQETSCSLVGHAHGPRRGNWNLGRRQSPDDRPSSAMLTFQFRNMISDHLPHVFRNASPCLPHSLPPAPGTWAALRRKATTLRSDCSARLHACAMVLGQHTQETFRKATDVSMTLIQISVIFPWSDCPSTQSTNARKKNIVRISTTELWGEP